jgi:hypothetical protein
MAGSRNPTGPAAHRDAGKQAADDPGRAVRRDARKRAEHCDGAKRLIQLGWGRGHGPSREEGDEVAGQGG